ncbi:Uncharacterised protein [Pseudomonas fluorescens]|uniref:Uncharacterized protein n=1 Tax=Pseudomonas fluorescens TaxID=294 RepID=A0A3S4PB26_PSEFL|nr:hypothetical protein [Pseudomonas fluorescens]VEF13045.1 Uncharacterised protein [Pseudomonas fluorescens]
MTLYEDEWAFWDDIVSKFMMKFASGDSNDERHVRKASECADLAVLERRKRKRVKLAGKDSSGIPAVAPLSVVAV